MAYPEYPTGGFPAESIRPYMTHLPSIRIVVAFE